MWLTSPTGLPYCRTGLDQSTQAKLLDSRELAQIVGQVLSDYLNWFDGYDIKFGFLQIS
jgi:hypothetical protein